MKTKSRIIRVDEDFSELLIDLKNKSDNDIPTTRLTKKLADYFKKTNPPLFNKKGQISGDILTFAILLFVSLFILIVIYNPFSTFFTNFGNSLNASNFTASATILSRGTLLLTSFDKFVLYYIVGNTILIWGLALLPETLFGIIAFWISLIALGFANLVIPYLSNAFETVMNADATILNSASSFPIAKFMLLHLPNISITIAGIGMAIFFFKPRS